MAATGYDMADVAKALTAFRRRFRPGALEGLPVMRDYLVAREMATRHPAARAPGAPPGTPESLPDLP